MARSLTVMLSGFSLGLSASTCAHLYQQARLEKQSFATKIHDTHKNEVRPRMDFFSEYEKHSASRGLHCTDAFKRPYDALDDMDKRAVEAMYTVSGFWDMVTDAYKSNLLRKDFFKADNEKWKKRAQNYMAVVEPLEKADYESSSFAAKYGDYHEKGNRPQQFAFIEKL